MNLDIVGVSGKAGSGKDFLAKHVLAARGYKPFALAWALRAQGYARLAPSNTATYDMVYHDKPPLIRDFLQQLGTEQGRDVFGQEYWVLQAEAWMETLARAGYGNKFVITDVRFPNEAQFVRDLGGKLIRMAGRRADLGAAAEHVSETALDSYIGWDAVLHNEAGMTATGLETQLVLLGVLDDR